MLIYVKMDLFQSIVSSERKNNTVCLSVRQGPEFSVVGVERGMEKNKKKTRTRPDAGVPLRPGF